MTDCWVNIMGQGAAHSLHLHPLSSISGTYYVAVPRGAPGLKFEDPRTGAVHGGAAASEQCLRAPNRPWVTLPAQRRAAGAV